MGREARIGSGERGQPKELQGRGLVAALVIDAKARFNTARLVTQEDGTAIPYRMHAACLDAISNVGLPFDTVFDTLTDDKSTLVRSADLPGAREDIIEFGGKTWEEAKRDLAAQIVEAEIILNSPRYAQRAERRDEVPTNIDASHLDTTGW